MKHLIQYGLPALLIGVTAGYLVADIRHRAESPSVSRTSSNESKSWFGKTEEAQTCAPIDYDRIAHICRGAQARSPASGTAGQGAGVVADGNGTLSGDRDQAQEGLELILTQSIETQVWSQRSGLHSRSLLMKANPTEAETFENLLVSAIRSGQLKVEAGAWVPARVAEAIQM